MDIRSLESKAAQIRMDLLTLIYEGKAGHIGGDLSCTDLFVALFYDKMKLDPKRPDWDGRDLFFLSKGHCVETYYSVLADLGYVQEDVGKRYMKFGSPYIGHPTRKIPGIEMNTGSLGHGLPIAVGAALGFKLDGRTNVVYVLMGDGEQAEGSIWEAAMAASNYGLDHLVAILDRNHLQISGNTEEVMQLESLADRYRAFGWHVIEIDGNDMRQIQLALATVPGKAGRPTLILADTVKGKGIPTMENVAKWHHGVPDETLYLSAMEHLKQQKEALNR